MTRRPTEQNDAVPRGNECAVHATMLTKTTFFSVVGLIVTLVIGYLAKAQTTFATNERVGAVEQRLDRTEKQIDKRFDSIEGKIDRLLQRGNP